MDGEGYRPPPAAARMCAEVLTAPAGRHPPLSVPDVCSQLPDAILELADYRGRKLLQQPARPAPVDTALSQSAGDKNTANGRPFGCTTPVTTPVSPNQ